MDEPNLEVRTIERSSFAVRFGAMAIDIAFVVILTVLTTIITEIWTFHSFSEEFSYLGYFGFTLTLFFSLFVSSVSSISTAIILTFLVILVEAFTGRTPGKIMLKLRIANPDGKKSSILILMLRSMLKNISVFMLCCSPFMGEIFIILGLLGGLAIFLGGFLVFRKERQALHDILAKTAVFNAKDLKNKNALI